MKWIEFAVYTTDEGIEAVCGALAAVGLEQVSIEESSARVEAHLETFRPFWDYADAQALAGADDPCVKAYIADLPENAAVLVSAREAVRGLERLRAELNLGTLELVETPVDEEDWANSWKRYYKPLPIGKRLLVCPSWEREGLAEGQLAGRELLLLDPGMVFGTGAHHTTRLCLEYLEEFTRPQMRVLDIGCGSGILAIAALLLGAKSAVCVDVDPVARDVVRENAAANAIAEERMAVHIGDIVRDERLRTRIAGQYDIVLANIVADVILALIPYIGPFLRPGGLFVCSGIIDERAAEIREALAQNGLTYASCRRSSEGADASAPESGWVAIMSRP